MEQKFFFAHFGRYWATFSNFVIYRLFSTGLVAKSPVTPTVFFATLWNNFLSHTMVGIGLLFVTWLFVVRLSRDMMQNDRWYLWWFFRLNWTDYFFRHYGRNWATFRNCVIYRLISAGLVAKWPVGPTIFFATLWNEKFSRTLWSVLGYFL